MQEVVEVVHEDEGCDPSPPDTGRQPGPAIRCRPGQGIMKRCQLSDPSVQQWRLVVRGNTNKQWQSWDLRRSSGPQCPPPPPGIDLGGGGGQDRKRRKRPRPRDTFRLNCQKTSAQSSICGPPRHRAHTTITLEKYLQPRAHRIMRGVSGCWTICSRGWFRLHVVPGVAAGGDCRIRAVLSLVL